MDKVTVKRDELLEKLKENKVKHRQIFEKALEGYRLTAIELLDKALEDAKAGRTITTSVYLEEPVDQTKDYDRAIGMLEMSVDDEVTITSQEYAQYVMDDWSWKRQFLTTNMGYAARAEGTLLPN